MVFTSIEAEPDSLHRSDIQKIMQQIFAQHVDKKSVSGEILKNSFRIYLEQFDPEKIYLFQKDLNPYLDMNAEALSTIEQQYRSSNYSAYETLNNTIAQSIKQARAIRAQLEQNPQELYQQALTSPIAVMEIEKNSVYPKTEQELKGNIRKHILGFLQAEVRRYGEKGVENYVPQALALYEKQLRSMEDQYLYTNDKDEMLSAEEQERLFTMHVLKALAKSLDAHTAFFDQQEAYDMRVRLEKDFEGIGIVFQQSPQGIMATHLIDGSPAAQDGSVKVGDILTEINGQKLEGIAFEKVMNLLRGEKDQAVKLAFLRKGERLAGDKTIDITLKRETIVLNNERVDVTSEQFGNGIIGRITLHSFYQNDQGITSERDVRNAIKKLDAEGNLRGLILDLRENSGGFLSQAVKVTGLFISNGIVVISKYANGDEKIYRDMDNRQVYNGPLIVLTSRATASAAEIVAQSLQDYGVAVVVGDDRTYGKGTIQSQTVTDKSSGSYFKVTIGKYYTVSGNTPQLYGVHADVVVPGPYAQLQLGEEFLDDHLKRDDKIADGFKDSLSDIDPTLRSWYLKYYIPSVQTKEKFWSDYLTQIKTNSEHRLSNNKNYQLFLKRFAPHVAPTLKDELVEEEKESNQNFGTADLQLSEAFNVLKDMVYLHDQARHKQLMVGSDFKLSLQQATTP